MITEFFEKKYGLTHASSQNLIKGIISTVILNLTIMLPMGLYLLLIYILINPLTGGEYIEPNLGIFILMIIVAAAAISLAHWKQYFYVYNTTYDSSVEKRINLAENIRELPLSYFERKDLSDLSATIMGDCTDLEHVFSHAIPQSIGALITLILMAIGLFMFNATLSVALLWVVPISFILLCSSIKFQDKYNEKIVQQSRLISDDVQECLDSVKDIKSYNYEEDYLKKLHNSNSGLQKARIKGELITGSLVTTSQLLLKLGMLTVIFVGIGMLINNQIDLFTLLVFIITSTIIFVPIESALIYLAEITMVDIKVKRMNEIESNVMSGGKTDYSVSNYNIHFENVSFSYDDEKEVIHDISFTAKQNEITALIGPSGGGKSTVSKLSANFWNPNKGIVKIDDVDISTINNEKILENYSIVFQDVVLFNSSIFDNIKVGKKDATDEEIYRVAKLARCDEFVDKLPEGYNTIIGENGRLLSGGQRQRISIARALLKDAPIIILDEATSFLDVENETSIQEALNTLIKNKTVIIIAHRMRTIRNVDKIVVLKDGKIAEEGKPDDLYANNGLFTKMVDIQSKSDEWLL
ncbi:MAG: ABC transporter ATP-binding protein [Methanosphaera stadtmanae]|nr:ABC transporter ATP-binding protein [Methanosphaera stadtmanae]